MRKLLICLFLAGCSTSPTDMLGKPIDDAISEYGYPASAVDYEGARAFFFEINEEPEPQTPEAKRKQDNRKKQVDKLLNQDMPILNTDFRTSKCVYTMNALWTNAARQWTTHSVTESPNCKGEK